MHRLLARFVCVLICLIVQGSACADLVRQPDVVAYQDTWTDWTNPSTNYGASSNITINGIGTNTYNAYLKFDLSGWNIPVGHKIARVYLKLTAVGTWPTGGRMYVHKTNDSTWNESTVTWNNRPSFNPCVLASGVPAFEVRFDLTNEFCLDLGTMISLAVDSDTTGGYSGICWYASKEYVTASYHPVLEIYTEEDPGLIEQPVLAPSADTWADGLSRNTNYGSSTNITFSGNSRIGYLKFNLVNWSVPSGQIIRRAYLKLTAVGTWPTGGTIRVHEANNNTWGESTLTWNNQPGFSSTIAGSASPGYDVNIEITDLVKSRVASTLALALDSNTTGGSDGICWYGSKEHAQTIYRPELRIYTETSPVTVDVNQDTWVDSTQPNANYGSDNLTVSPGGPRNAYLKFDLTSWEPPVGHEVNRVFLRMTATGTWPTGGNVHVHAANNDTWNESTVTWNNQPGYNAEAIASAPPWLWKSIAQVS